MSHLYTATGDRGTTSLVGGKRVAKHSPRLEAYGTLDELNAHLGVVIAALPQTPVFNDPRQCLIQAQCLLFNIGSYLATPPSSKLYTKTVKGVDGECIAAIERAIDAIDEQLPKLNTFVMPGGTMAAAQTHVARTVCRRAERAILAMKEAEVQVVNHDVLKYVNRLSDFLFALARLCNVATQTPEILWQSAE